MSWLNYFDRLVTRNRPKKRGSFAIEFAGKMIKKRKKSLGDLDLEQEFKEARFGSERNGKSPIERLARMKYVVDIPTQAIMGELRIRVNKINKEITRQNKMRVSPNNRDSYKKRLPTGRNSLQHPEVKKIYEEIRNEAPFKDILEVRAAQEKRIKEWVDHLVSHGYSSRFQKLILETILHYNYNWMIKHDGRWLYKERKGKYTTDNFPPIGAVEHLVVAKLSTLYNLFFSDDSEDRKKYLNYSENLRTAVEGGDVREAFYLVKDEVEGEILDENTLRIVENFEATLDKFEHFTFKNKNNEEQKKKLRD